MKGYRNFAIFLLCVLFATFEISKNDRLYADEDKATAKAVLDASESDARFESYVLGILDGIENANIAREKNDGPYCKPSDFKITVDQARRVTRDWLNQDKRREELSLGIAVYFALVRTFPCK